MRIFLAGAAGVIGRNLVPLLVADGHTVFGTTRAAAKAAQIEALGAHPVIMDAFDEDAAMRAVGAAKPDVLVHQLTDLPQTFDAGRLAAALEANARLRIEGTRNLMAAAKAAGVGRVVAQSIAFVYAPGRKPFMESDPLDAGGPQARTVAGVLALEAAVTATPGIEGLVLRYGKLFGPGTWTAVPNGTGFVHVEAAAHAARLAVTRGEPGIYNIAADDGEVDTRRARAQFRWSADFRA